MRPPSLRVYPFEGAILCAIREFFLKFGGENFARLRNIHNFAMSNAYRTPGARVPDEATIIGSPVRFRHSSRCCNFLFASAACRCDLQTIRARCHWPPMVWLRRRSRSGISQKTSFDAYRGGTRESGCHDTTGLRAAKGVSTPGLPRRPVALHDIWLMP